VAGALPDPAAFAFRAELTHEPRPELPDATLASLRDVLRRREEVASAWLTRERRTPIAGGAEMLGTALALILREPPVDEPDPPNRYHDLCAAVLHVLAGNGSDAGVSVPTRRALPAVRDFGVCVFEREPE